MSSIFLKLKGIARRLVESPTGARGQSKLPGLANEQKLAPQPATIANRSDYKGTWEKLAHDNDSAKMWVAGYTDEAEFLRSGLHTVEVLERYVGIRPTDHILEIGCGVGRVGAVLSSRCAKWTGTDISSNMLVHARTRLRDRSNVDLVELSTVGLKEIPSASMDLVYCTVVFMHLFEWDRYRYFEEAFRVLRPGGRCLFDNVDITSDHGRKFFLESCSYPLDARPAQIGMVSTGDELKTYALWAGFTDIAVHRWNNAWVGVAAVKP